MTWENMYQMVSTILRGQSIDPVLFTEMLNEARMNREQERDWVYLLKQDKSQSWIPGDTWETPKDLPDDFIRFKETRPFQLWDGNPNPGSLVEPVDIVPYEDFLFTNSSSYTVGIDYANDVYYFGGNTTQTLIIVLSYFPDYGDIVQETDGVSTTWNKIPGRFHKILPYDVACMYRLGVDYDDLGARNADGNNQRAEAIAASMRKWDGSLARSNIKNKDYFPPEMNTFVNHRINTGYNGGSYG